MIRPVRLLLLVSAIGLAVAACGNGGSGESSVPPAGSPVASESEPPTDSGPAPEESSGDETAVAPQPAAPVPEPAPVDQPPAPVDPPASNAPPPPPDAAPSAPPTFEPTPGARAFRTGKLAAGTYTTVGFRERFELDLPAGWSGVIPEQPDVVAFARSARPGESIAFVYPDALTGVIDANASAADADALKPTDVGAPPSDWISWLERHPRLAVGPRAQLEISGRPAVAVDVTVRDGFTTDGCPGECVFTFFDSKGAVYGTSSEYPERHILLEVDGAPVLILIGAPPRRFEQFVREAEKVLETTRFVETRQPLPGEEPPAPTPAPAPTEPAPAESVPGESVPDESVPDESAPTDTGELPPYLSPPGPPSPLEA